MLFGMNTFNLRIAFKIYTIYQETFGSSYRTKKNFFINYLKSNLKGNHFFQNINRLTNSKYSRYYPKNDDRSHTNFQKMDSFNKSLYEMFHCSILPTLLRNYDRYSMANGVESRMPFLDWRLVSYTFSLPTSSKIGNGYTKRVLRDSLKNILIDDVRLRKRKVGWNAPINNWLKGPLSYLLEDKNILNNLDSKEKNLINKFKLNDNPNFLEGHQIFCIINPYLYL